MNGNFYLTETKKLVAKTPKALIDETNSRAYEEEQLWRFIENGDYNGYKSSLYSRKTSIIWRRRFYGDDCIRDVREFNESELYDVMSIFISLCARHAVTGGASPIEVFTLADLVRNDFKNNRTPEKMLELCDACAYSMATLVKERKEKRTGIVGKAKTFVKANVYQKLSVGIVAENLGINYNTLSAAFSERAEMTLKKYILFEKCEEAKRLLSSSDSSLAEIAVDLCFSSQSHFQRAFKEFYGITPDKFRKANG